MMGEDKREMEENARSICALSMGSNTPFNLNFSSRVLKDFIFSKMINNTMYNMHVLLENNAFYGEKKEKKNPVHISRQFRDIFLYASTKERDSLKKANKGTSEEIQVLENF